MAGYTAGKTFTQLAHAIQTRVGNVIEAAQFTLKHLDGTAVAVPKNIKGDAIGTTGGANPAYSDVDGYPNPFYKHGDYIAEWTAYGDTTQRVIRIPPVFEDFGMVDATKYDGIDPTGATDSYAAITAAIAECSGKFILFFPPGNYQIGTRVTLLNNTYIRGAGPALTRFFAAPALTGAMFFDAAVIDNCIIENVTIDGMGANRDTVNPNVKFTSGSTRCFLRNSHIINAGADKNAGGTIIGGGFHIDFPVTQGGIHNCIVGGGYRDGIWCALSKQSYITNNIILECGDDGISMWGSEDMVVANNILSCMTFSRKAGRGIVFGQGKRNVIANNYIEGWERGGISFSEDGTQYNQVTGNVISNAGANNDAGIWGDGIFISLDSSQNAVGNSFVGNLIIDPREHGIRLEMLGTGGIMEDTNIQDNVIISTGTQVFRSGVGCGIVLDTSAPGVTNQVKRTNIMGNFIKGFDREGINIKGQSTNRVKDIFIENNKIYDSGDVFAAVNAYAIKINYVDNFGVRNNIGADVQVVGDSQLGFWIDNPGTGSGRISGNNFRECLSNISTNKLEDLVYLVVDGNTGWNPFEGRVTIGTGVAWTALGNGTFKRTIGPISFGTALNSAALTPKVTANTSVAGWFVSVSSITDTGLTFEVTSVAGDPGTGASGTIHWRASF